jgi:ATP-binding cassette subfamily F protein 3
MIRLDNIEKTYGERSLFNELTWHIRPSEKVGLIGDNGSGKTTLLNILAGDCSPDNGKRIARKGLIIGYLGQETAAEGGDVCLIDEVKGGRGDLIDLEIRMDEITRIMSEPDGQTDDAAMNLCRLQEEYEHLGGYEYQATAKAIASGLGFTEDDLKRPMVKFSGGWRMRAQLARILLSKPDLLLLDEPTNHLDLESTIWLEKFIQNFEGALVIISHDRYFLNRMIKSIGELEHGDFTLYPHNYDNYLEVKRQRMEILEKQIEGRRKLVAKQTKFIERFRAKNTKATQVQSRIKALNKLSTIKSHRDTATVKFRFMQSGRLNKAVVDIKDVVAGYGDNIVYDKLNFTLWRGDRIALVGPNGAGKSTLMKMIAGKTPIKSGELIMGSNIEKSYFAQHQIESLDLGKTVLDEVISNIPNDSTPKARTALGAFLFRGDDVSKKISTLSGGEKSRVALTKLALTPTNLLLLDEPTNHLDLKSRAALENALSQYDGSILMISHDRSFIDHLVNKVIHVEDGVLTEYLGTYSDYEKLRDKATGDIRSKTKKRRSEPNVGSAQNASSDNSKMSKKEIRREAARKRSMLTERLKPTKAKLSSVVEEIAELEKTIAEYESLLADSANHNNIELIKNTSRSISSARAEHGILLGRWEQLAIDIEEMTEATGGQ